MKAMELIAAMVYDSGVAASGCIWNAHEYSTYSEYFGKSRLVSGEVEIPSKYFYLYVDTNELNDIYIYVPVGLVAYQEMRVRPDAVLRTVDDAQHICLWRIEE